MATAAPMFHGHGVSPDLLSGIAGRLGGTTAPQGEKPKDDGHQHIAIIDDIAQADFSNLMSAPYQAYIESIDGEDILINEETRDALGQGKLCFSFSAATVYSIDSAALICDALTARGVLSPVRRSDVELSLHETISNAVVHGNLGLESNRKGDALHFAEFAQELQTRMRLPVAKLRVDISISWDSEFLDITVADKGKGYDESKLPADIDPFAPAGRGLSIIRSLTLAMNVTHGGRVTTLRFLT
jgi:anti-sigma regulatory factor (Ser/Thr protein kinase)